MAQETPKKKAYYLTSEKTDAVIKQWWLALHENPGERAQLRRCSSPSEVAYLPPYIRLMSSLQKNEFKSQDSDLRIASIAGLLAHLRPVDNAVTSDDTREEPNNENDEQEENAATSTPDSENSFGIGIRAFGKKLGETSGGKALLSGLRFRRFLQTTNPDERYRLLVRILRIIRQQGHAISPLSVAATVYWWESDNTRQQLAFGYYSSAPNDEP